MPYFQTFNAFWYNANLIISKVCTKVCTNLSTRPILTKPSVLSVCTSIGLIVSMGSYINTQSLYYDYKFGNGANCNLETHFHWLVNSKLIKKTFPFD